MAGSLNPTPKIQVYSIPGQNFKCKQLKLRIEVGVSLAPQLWFNFFRPPFCGPLTYDSGFSYRFQTGTHIGTTPLNPAFVKARPPREVGKTGGRFSWHCQAKRMLPRLKGGIEDLPSSKGGGCCIDTFFSFKKKHPFERSSSTDYGNVAWTFFSLKVGDDLSFWLIVCVPLGWNHLRNRSFCILMSLMIPEIGVRWWYSTLWSRCFCFFWYYKIWRRHVACPCERHVTYMLYA